MAETLIFLNSLAHSNVMFILGFRHGVMNPGDFPARGRESS